MWWGLDVGAGQSQSWLRVGRALGRSPRSRSRDASNCIPCGRDGCKVVFSARVRVRAGVFPRRYVSRADVLPRRCVSRAGVFPRGCGLLMGVSCAGIGQTLKNKGKRTRGGKRPRWKTPAQGKHPRRKTPTRKLHPRRKTPARKPHPRRKTPAQDNTRARNTTLQQPRSRERSDAKNVKRDQWTGEPGACLRCVAAGAGQASGAFRNALQPGQARHPPIAQPMWKPTNENLRATHLRSSPRKPQGAFELSRRGGWTELPLISAVILLLVISLSLLVVGMRRRGFFAFIWTRCPLRLFD